MSKKGPSSEEAEFQRHTQAYIHRLEGYQEVLRQNLAVIEELKKAHQVSIQSLPTQKVIISSRIRDPQLDELSRARDAELEAKCQKLEEKVRNLHL